MNARSALRYSCLLFAAVCGFSPSLRLHAQAVSPPPPTSADTDWQTLKNFGRPIPPPTTGLKPTPAQLQATFLSQADQLKAFYTQYPTHASAREAKQREVLALALAGLNGDTSQDARRDKILTEVRNDPMLPPGQRSEAVAWSSRVAIKRQNLSRGAALLAAEESLTRNLIQEYPGIPGGYESLLGIAQASPPDRGTIIARDLLAMGAASPAINSGAQRLLKRNALMGSPLDPILRKADAAAFVSGGPPMATVVYAWSSSVAQSITAAKRMAGQASRVRFMGVCLDRDVATARQAAVAAGLPGEQYYDSRGDASPLADALALERTPLAYLVDRGGAIRDVQGYIDFSVKVKQLEK